MLDKALLREHPDVVRRSLRRRQLPDAPVDEFLALDERWRTAVTALDRLKAERNQVSAEFARARPAGAETLQALRERSTAIGQQIEASERDAAALEHQANAVLAG